MEWMEKKIKRSHWLRMNLIQAIEKKILERNSLICPLHIDSNVHAQRETSFQWKIPVSKKKMSCQ